MGDVEYGELQQLLARIAGDGAGALVDPQEAPLRIDFGDGNARVLICCGEPLLALGERVRCPLGLGDVLEDAHAIEKPALAVAHGGAHDGSPDHAAVLAHDALLDGIAVDLAGDELAILTQVLVPIFRMHDVEDAAARELLARTPGDRARRRIDAHAPTFGIGLGNADRGMLVGDGEAAILLDESLLGGGEPPEQLGRGPIAGSRGRVHAHGSVLTRGGSPVAAERKRRAKDGVQKIMATPPRQGPIQPLRSQIRVSALTRNFAFGSAKELAALKYRKNLLNLFGKNSD